MKLVGGKLTPSGETGAFVGKIFKGGVMDQLGQLKEGMSIIFLHHGRLISSCHRKALSYCKKT